MIRFKCSGCEKRYNVPDSFAGKTAGCSACGAIMQVPRPPAAPTTRASAPPMAVQSVLSVRQRRLAADHQQMQEFFGKDGIIRLISAQGDPPDLYEIEYTVRGIERMERDGPVFRDLHRVQIQMTRDYPRLCPQCRMLTPIFHPNINESSICIGDHWTAGEQLSDLAIRIGEMIAYQAYNAKSPLNAEAAMWADLNSDQLPIDKQSLLPVIGE